MRTVRWIGVAAFGAMASAAAPSTLDPARTRLHVGRGNQLRVTPH